MTCSALYSNMSLFSLSIIIVRINMEGHGCGTTAISDQIWIFLATVLLQGEEVLAELSWDEQATKIQAMVVDWMQHL